MTRMALTQQVCHQCSHAPPDRNDDVVSCWLMWGTLIIWSRVLSNQRTICSDLCPSLHALVSQLQLVRVFHLMCHGRLWKKYLMETQCCGGQTMQLISACGVIESLLLSAVDIIAGTLLLTKLMFLIF